MAIAFVAAGGKAASSASTFVKPLLPAMQSNDIAILVASCRQGASSTLAVTDGGSIGTWNAITGSPQNPNSDSKLYAWWGRYTSGTTEPTVTRTNGSCICADIAAYRGCSTAVNPINNQASGTAVASTALSFNTGISTTKNNCMVLLLNSTGADSNVAQLGSQANANLSAIAERVDDCTNLGPGGGIAITEGFLASSGAIGTWTATYVTSTGQGIICAALAPKEGWTNIAKVSNVAASAIGKICGAAASAIGKIDGKAV